MKSSKQLASKLERKQTDDSLIVERGKSDDSFEAYRAKSELETDKAVKAQRHEADEARLKRRTAADVQHPETKVLLKERIHEDDAIIEERKESDEAIDRERDESERILNRLVSHERQSTDKNLSGERIKNDADAEAAAKLLEAEQAAHVTTKTALTTREEFVAIVSHDLKNPIGAILSASELLVCDPTFEALSEDAKYCVGVIQRNAETSLRLIHDILDMERISEGKFVLNVERNRISEIIQDAIDTHAHTADLKHIKLSTDTKDYQGSIDCDRDRVEQILSNLIGNALKFTANGGVVYVTVDDKKTAIEVSVNDSGPGIPENQKRRIFERFAQIENKDRAGLGLGLYISKTFVELHKGNLWVTASKEHGSRFSFTLPY